MVYLEIDGKRMSKFALGTVEFGSTVSEKDGFAVMDEFFKRGGNVFDTARVYCDWLEDGANKSEITLGKWVKTRNIREQVWISTKGGHPPQNDLHASRIDERNVTADLEASLRYLQTDYVDVYYLHRDDESKPVSEIMPFLDGFVRSGKARYLGASNWRTERIEQANKYAEEHGLTKFSFSQIMWSYAQVNKAGETDDTLVIMDENELAWYENSDVIVMPFSSQAQGFYSKVIQKGLEGVSERQRLKYVNEVNLHRIEKLKRIHEETGISPTAIGLNHLIRHERINVVPLIGATTMDRLNDSFRAFELPERYFKELRD